MSLVPALTSNTSGLPFVEVSATSERDSNYAYNPFKSTGGNWSPLQYNIDNQWLKLKFNIPVKVTSYLIGNIAANSGFFNQLPKKWELQASNDDFTTFDILDTQDNQTWTSVEDRTFNINNSKYYSQYRIYIISNNGNANFLIVGKVALYGDIKEISNKILLLSNEKTYSFESIQESHILNMTSNTSPSPYVVTASHTRSSTYAPWKVFNGTNASESDSWHTSTAVGDKWIQIDFGSVRRVNEVHVTSINHSTATMRSPRSFSVLGSNDDVNFDTLFQTENDITSWNMNETMTFYFNNEKKYRFYRFLVKKTIEDMTSFDLRIGQLLYSYNGKKVMELPNSSVSNFIKYGMDSPVKVDGALLSKNYILTENDSENTEGLWTTQLNRKPLSIKFN